MALFCSEFRNLAFILKTVNVLKKCDGGAHLRVVFCLVSKY